MWLKRAELVGGKDRFAIFAGRGGNAGGEWDLFVLALAWRALGRAHSLLARFLRQHLALVGNPT